MKTRDIISIPHIFPLRYDDSCIPIQLTPLLTVEHPYSVLNRRNTIEANPVVESTTVRKEKQKQSPSLLQIPKKSIMGSPRYLTNTIMPKIPLSPPHVYPTIKTTPPFSPTGGPPEPQPSLPQEQQQQLVNPLRRHVSTANWVDKGSSVESTTKLACYDSTPILSPDPAYSSASSQPSFGMSI